MMKAKAGTTKKNRHGDNSRGQTKNFFFQCLFLSATNKRMLLMMIIFCGIYGITFLYTLMLSDSYRNPIPPQEAPSSAGTAGADKALALREYVNVDSKRIGVTSSRDIIKLKKETDKKDTQDTSHLHPAMNNSINIPDRTNTTTTATTTTLTDPRRAVMILAVFPDSIQRISAIWSQLECFANDYDKIILACEEGNEHMKAALATLSDEVARKMPKVAERLEIQFFVNGDMWDTGLWCSTLTDSGILEKGPDGTYVGGTSKSNFQDFLLINDSSMALEKTNELMDAVRTMDLAMASFNFWDADDHANYRPYLKEPVKEPFWVESYARAFSLEGIQIFTDKLCSREKPIDWREDCPDMEKWEHLGTMRRRKKCVVRLTETDVASFYPRNKVHGIYPGKVPDHMLKVKEAFTLKKSWTGHYAFWSDVLRDEMKFPVVKISEQNFFTYAKEKRPEDFATCTKEMDTGALIAPFVEKELWFGESIEVEERERDGGKTATIHILEVVVAYCKADLNWMKTDILGPRKLKLAGITEVKMTILSKCGHEEHIPNFHFTDHHPISEVNVVSLPNVGGCDYAYAHFINDFVSRRTKEDAMSSVILFIKDTPRTKKNFHYRHHSGYRTIEEILKITTSGKFVCGIKPDCTTTTYHDTEVLSRFSLSRYTRISERVKGQKEEATEGFNIHGYENLRDFHNRALNWTFPHKKMTPVCYGGTFAMPALRLISVSNQNETKGVVKRLEDVLSRESKIGITVEEHFTERTWAGLFSVPVTKDQIRVILALSKKKGRLTRGKKDQKSVFGAFVAEKSRCS